MGIRRSLIIIVCAFWLLAFGETGEQRRPNFLFITLDTTRLDHLGFYGGRTRTPNLNALAADSVVFDNYYAAINLTTPSHLSMFSSQYPPTFGLFENLKRRMPSSVHLLPQILHANGYATYGLTSAFFLGKQWLPDLAGSFDEFDSPNEAFWNGKQMASRWENLVLSGKIKKDQEFFAWLHFYDPHMPYDPPLIYQQMYLKDWRGGEEIPDLKTRPYYDWFREAEVSRTAKGRALYKSEISFMDAQIGHVLYTLKRARLMENTVIVIVADHGELLGEHGEFFGHGKLHEGNIHVPFLLYKQGIAPRRVQDIVGSVDLAPTVLNLAQIESPREYMGRSLVPLIKGGVMKPIPVFSYHQGNRGVAVVQSPFKLILKKEDYDGGGGISLYDIRKDPSELYDLALVKGYMVRQLEALLSMVPVSNEAPSYDNLTPEELEKMKAIGYVN